MEKSYSDISNDAGLEIGNENINSRFIHGKIRRCRVMLILELIFKLLV